MLREAMVLLAPILVVPLLIWIGYRYVPLLAGAGRARVYLLMLLCAASVAVQMSMVHAGAYPLTTWTMYTHPGITPDTWRFVAVSGDQETDFALKEVAPVHQNRPFYRKIALIAATAESAPSASERSQAMERLQGLLGAFIEIHNERRPELTLDEIRVDRCRVDIRAPRPRDEVDCTPFARVRPGLPHAP